MWRWLCVLVVVSCNKEPEKPFSCSRAEIHEAKNQVMIDRGLKEYDVHLTRCSDGSDRWVYTKVPSAGKLDVECKTTDVKHNERTLKFQGTSTHFELDPRDPDTPNTRQWAADLCRWPLQ